MLDLKKIILPAAVEVAGVLYGINTDFRNWLLFAEMIQEPHTALEYDFLYTGKKPQDRAAGFTALYNFYKNEQTLPRPTTHGTKEILIDFTYDADLIYSAFLEQYNIDLYATDEHGKIKPLHWWKFQALLNGLHDTKLNEVMGYRGFNENDKREYNDQMKEARRCWHIPTKADEEAKESYKYFNSLFEKPKEK